LDALDQKHSVLIKIVSLKNKFFTKGKPEQHTALEVKYYVFGLKCLVPESLSLVRKPG
jgi:hypothetical protein